MRRKISCVVVAVLVALLFTGLLNLPINHFWELGQGEATIHWGNNGSSSWYSVVPQRGFEEVSKWGPAVGAFHHSVSYLIAKDGKVSMTTDYQTYTFVPVLPDWAKEVLKEGRRRVEEHRRVAKPA